MKTVVVSLIVIALAGCKSKSAPSGQGGSASAAEPAAGRAAPAAGSAARVVRGEDGTSGNAPFGIELYSPANDVPGPIVGAIGHDDRTDNDRKLDAGRKPGEVLAFFRVAPGQRIGELFAGGGYTTELLARVVGENGRVWAQNTKDVLDRLARKPLTERLARLNMPSVVMVEQPAEAPFPPEAKQLDAVICVLNYHDFVWQKVDRAKLNAAVFAALKPGGIYGIVDHSAAAGSGVRDVETLHRIDEATVKQEILAAGFKLDGESGALRNPADPRDWNSSPKAAEEAHRRGTSDRFVLRFVRP